MENYNCDNALGLMVTSEMLDAIMAGETKRYDLELNEDTYQEILEMLDGNIVVMSDDVPDESVGCYFYNGGEFPYMLRRWLQYLIFSDGERQVAAEIKYTKTKVKERFHFDANDEAVDDENGDCCVWNVIFGFATYI